MGYKVDESQIAYRLNYHYAMYKGKPVYLYAKRISQSPSAYDRREDTYELWAYWVGSDEDTFRVDVAEPTFSAATLQAGYCHGPNGGLGYIHAYSGALDYVPISSGFNIPERNSKKLLQCLTGVHSTFHEALEKVTKIPRKKAWPFHRDFALSRDTGFSEINVTYKGTRVIGQYCPKTKRLHLRSGPTMKLIKRKLDKLINTSEVSNEQNT